eukprot:m.128211 g.128211  ORF g.128211 m.128211 type:complete len:198 (-) comp52285_c0_seq1:40-633(-)
MVQVPTAAVHASTLVATAIVAYASPPSFTSLFSWHPLLLTIGFVLLMPQGALVISGRGLGGPRIPVHATLMGLAVLAIALGFAAIFYNKVLFLRPHFTTWHGLIGLIVSAAAIVMWSGALGYFIKGAKPFVERIGGNGAFAKAVRGHKLIGSMVLSGMVVEFVLAQQTSFWQSTINMPLTVVFFVALAIIRISIRLY